MRFLCVLALVLSVFYGEAEAFGRRRVYNTSRSELISTDSTSTAQGIANIMARLRTVGHWGGNPGYEGCGCGPTKEAAYRICCFANSGMETVDVGYAQDSNGTWYCCRRYR
jgi:hypothetical protein